MIAPLPATLPLLGGALAWDTRTPRPSEDAFWLAACVPALPSATRVLDMGCGPGAVMLALWARQPHLALTGVDCDPATLAHAALNGAANPMALPPAFIKADVLAPAWPAPATPKWPVVVCNPPFHSQTRGHSSPSARKTLAHGLPDIGLWAATWARTLVPQGHLYAIVHAQLQGPLIQALQAFGGVLALAPVATHPTRAPKRLLVHWQATAQPLSTRLCAVVPTYNSTLRRAVLEDAKPLAPFSSN